MHKTKLCLSPNDISFYFIKTKGRMNERKKTEAKRYTM